MMKKAITVLTVVFMLAISVSASATYLGPVISFASQLKNEMSSLGKALAALMFLYGGAKYAYTADDPGGRKQGMAICVAAVIAYIIIISADNIIGQIL
jgi:multisubunit Na+/H+ antiporter MnhB subunit